MVERLLPKQHTRVRFPSPAPPPLQEGLTVKMRVSSGVFRTIVRTRPPISAHVRPCPALLLCEPPSAFFLALGSRVQLREPREPFHAGGAWRATWAGQRGRSGTMAADSRRRRAQGGKMEREGLRGGESEAKALAVAGRGAGERSEAGRGDCARSATFSERASRHSASQHDARAGWRTFRALARRAATREASRGSCLAAVAGSGGRALASNPAGNERSHKGERRRASPEWRRGRARASEGRARFHTVRASRLTLGEKQRP